MAKDIDTLISKRIRTILEKDNLSDEDLKFLLLYRESKRKGSFETLIKTGKKIIKFLNSNTEDDE